MQIITKSFKETQKAGQALAKEILETKIKSKNAFVIALQGNLGSGKTCFIQGMAKGLGIKEQITSPTFVIFKKYKNFYHIDCYRLNSEKDILDLGFKEIVNNSKNIIAIEWAEKINKILPKNSLKIKFKYIDKNKREIII